MFSLSNHPTSIWSVLNHSFKLYKTIWVKILPLTLLLLICFSPFHILPVTLKHLLTLKDVTLLLGGIVGVIAIAGLFLWNVALYYAYSIMMNREKNLTCAFSFVLRKFPLLFIANILLLMIYFVGMLFAILPGIFLLYLFCFFPLGILINETSIIDSFKQSKQLVWGHWWRTFGTIIIASIFPFLIGCVLGVALNIMIIVFKMETFYSFLVTRTIIAMLFFPWWIAVFLCLYHDLQLRLNQKKKTME